MKVFNTFFKITKKSIGTIILYIGIFVFVSILTASFGSQNDTTNFEASKISMAVVDRDHSSTSQGLYNYLSETQTLVDIEDNQEVFQDELFYRNVHLIVIIPENFEADLTAGKDTHIESIEIPNSTDGIYLEMQLEQYLSTLKNYLSIGVDPTEALAKTNDLMSQQTPVTVDAADTAVNSTPKYYNYFALMPYALVGIMVSILGMVLLVFNEDDLRKRTICSAYSLKKRNISLTLACLTLTVVILVILLILPIFLYGFDMFSDANYIYLLLNSVAMAVFSTALGFLIGLICKKVEQVAIFGTTFSLGFNFLGGIFVPLSMMPKAVLNISKFIPTYWYSTTSTILAENSKITGNNLHDVLFGILIQFGFAIAAFGIALVVSRRKSQSA